MELTLYPPSSRYHGVSIAEITMPDGRTVRFLRRRFLPDPSALVQVAEHRVADGDRLDNVAARYLGDPLAAWRIADAHPELRMDVLVEEIGRRLRITLPDGMPAGMHGRPGGGNANA
jgi:hypothetical protein